MKRIVGIRKSYEDFDDAQKVKYMFKWGKDTIEEGFAALESLLEKQNNGKGFRYCTDDSNVTMADICLVPQVYNANRFGVDMDKFPNIKRINDNINQLEACKRSHPQNMIDAIPPSKL